MFKHILITSIFLLGLSSQYAFAAEVKTLNASIKITEIPKCVGMKEAISIALNNNHKLRSSHNSLFAKEAEIGIARSGLLPQINFSEDLIWTNNPANVFALKLNQEKLTANDFAMAPASFNDPGRYTNFLSQASFSQVLFDRNKSLNLKIAKKDFQVKENQFLRVKENTAIEVTKAFLMVRTAKSFANVAKLAVLDAREHMRITEVRYENEVGLYSDTLRANTSLKRAEQSLVSADKNYKVSTRGLGTLLGYAESIDITDELPNLKLCDQSYYTKSAIVREDFIALKLQYENSKNNLSLAKSAYCPTLGVGGNYSVYDESISFGFDGHNFQLFGFLKWNLFDGNNKKHKANQAVYKRAQLREELEGYQEAILYSVYDAYLNVEKSQANLLLAKSAFASAQEGVRLVLVRHQNSLSPIIDLLDAQLNLDESRADLVAMENEYLFSLINLSYQSGTIFKDLQIN